MTVRIPREKTTASRVRGIRLRTGIESLWRKGGRRTRTDFASDLPPKAWAIVLVVLFAWVDAGPGDLIAAQKERGFFGCLRQVALRFTDPAECSL